MAYAQEKPVEIAVEGEYTRAQPVHLEADEVEAYRFGDKVACRDGDGAWKLQTQPPAITGEAPQGEEDEGQNQESIWATVALPLPHEMLADIDRKIDGLRRQQDEGGLLSADRIVYSAELRPDAARQILKCLHRPDDLACSLRVTTSEGVVEKIELLATRKNRAVSPGAPATSAERGQSDLQLTYQLDDVNEDVEVEVPEAAQRLLFGGG